MSTDSQANQDNQTNQPKQGQGQRTINGIPWQQHYINNIKSNITVVQGHIGTLEQVYENDALCELAAISAIQRLNMIINNLHLFLDNISPQNLQHFDPNSYTPPQAD